MTANWRNLRRAPTVLLISEDEQLAHFVRGVIKRPWKVLCRGTDKFISRKLLASPRVRLAIIDDQAVEENDRGRLLEQIRRRFSGISLLYVAGSQSNSNEKRARGNGAHYYISKPLPLERFRYVLQSFLQVQQVDEIPAHSSRRKSRVNTEAKAESEGHTDPGIRRLLIELNREDSELRSHLLEAALAGLRLERNPESRELRRDAAQLSATIEPILSHHLDAEDRQLLTWLERQGGLSPEATRKVRAYHERLRTLLDARAHAEVDCLTDVQAREVGRALRGLAVKLDDAIDDEERRLFPSIRKALFSVERES